MSKIEYFRIEKLFNQYNVNLDFNNDVNIFLGENGMGKTTILNCLYCVLSGKLEKLDNVVFEKLEIKFVNQNPLTLYKSDLIRYLEEHIYDSARYRRTRTNLGGLFSKKEISYLRSFAKDGAYNREDIMPYLVRISEVYRMPLRFAEEEIHRYIYSYYKEESGDSDKVVNFKTSVESSIEEDVLYFPTYRRIEEDMSNLGIDVDKDNVKNRLIQFGMSDVEKKIESMVETIKSESITGFNKMTGILFKQYLNNDIFSENEKPINYEKLNIALDRLGNEIDDDDKEKIKWLVSSNSIYDTKNKYLLNLIVNLIESYEKQSKYDEKIKKYRDVCNAYLDGKKYIYDESNVTLRIFRDNYSRPISINNLSSGEKQVLSIFSKLYLETEKPCIILFDEPELSLSIKWQSRFLPDIMESQKCNMLIAVTHSPFIFENDYDLLAKDMGACIVEA